MVDCGVLQFGDFTLKSGRKSPFFMNAGGYVTGGQLKRLGEYYAHAIHNTYGDDFDVLFGPAYKGIPLSVVTAVAYSELFGREIRYCSNRKEEKDHGDAGILLGSRLGDGDRVVIIEDVTTSGKSDYQIAGKGGNKRADGFPKPRGSRAVRQGGSADRDTGNIRLSHVGNREHERSDGVSV